MLEQPKEGSLSQQQSDVTQGPRLDHSFLGALQPRTHSLPVAPTSLKPDLPLLTSVRTTVGLGPLPSFCLLPQW